MSDLTVKPATPALEKLTLWCALHSLACELVYYDGSGMTSQGWFIKVWSVHEPENQTHFYTHRDFAEMKSRCQVIFLMP